MKRPSSIGRLIRSVRQKADTPLCSDAYIHAMLRLATPHGFTLLELLVTVLIIGIVLSIGIPSYLEYSANTRVSAAANDLLASFKVARSEARRTGSIVTICASADADSGSATCHGELADGWIVFMDRNGNLQREVEDEQVVRAHGAIHESLSLRVIDRANWFSFDRSGLGRGVAADMPMFSAALFCDKRGNAEESGGLSAARYLAVTPIGRAVLVRDAMTIEAAGGC